MATLTERLKDATLDSRKKFDAEVRKMRSNLKAIEKKLVAKEKQARKYIQTNPRKAVALAAAAGALAGALAAMAAKRKK